VRKPIDTASSLTYIMGSSLTSSIACVMDMRTRDKPLLAPNQIMLPLPAGDDTRRTEGPYRLSACGVIESRKIACQHTLTVKGVIFGIGCKTDRVTRFVGRNLRLMSSVAGCGVHTGTSWLYLTLQTALAVLGGTKLRFLRFPSLVYTRS
jgi:hypothetical protein